MAAATIRVNGLAGLQRASKAAGKATGREVSRALKEAGVPVQARAQTLAVGIGAGTRWSRMRIGATTKKVYVAPASRRSGGSPRPNFGGRLLDRAMGPALEQEQDTTIVRMEQALDRIADIFERGA